MGAVGIAAIVAATLQRFISEPLLRLTTVAREVTHEHQYEPKAAVGGPGEVGELVRARDRAMEASRAKGEFLAKGLGVKSPMDRL